MNGFQSEEIYNQLDDADQWLRNQVKKFKAEFTMYGVNFGYDKGIII